MKYFIQTFGCQANKSDSERTAAELESRGMTKAETIDRADQVVINTCMIRKSAENRVYGLVNNLTKLKKKPKIILTGCMVGMAVRDTSGKLLAVLKKRMPAVDEFLPIEEVGFNHAPLRIDHEHAWVPISNGCNNYCTFCVVPYARGREVSRPFDEIIAKCYHLKLGHYKKITLVGQNVNSYGADLLMGIENIQTQRDLEKPFFNRRDQRVTTKDQTLTQQPPGLPRPVFVKHLGRYRIPTLFPALLDRIAKIGFEEINFMSANPWDFSDELIEVVAQNPNISKDIHLPVQSGDNNVLKRMNRWYTREEYLDLVSRMREKIQNLTLSTDIIVGFCQETNEEFENTVLLAQQIHFSKAYVSRYSDRPLTRAHTKLADDVNPQIKKKRWKILEDLINKPNLKKP